MRDRMVLCRAYKDELQSWYWQKNYKYSSGTVMSTQIPMLSMISIQAIPLVWNIQLTCCLSSLSY